MPRVIAIHADDGLSTAQKDLLETTFKNRVAERFGVDTRLTPDSVDYLPLRFEKGHNGSSALVTATIQANWSKYREEHQIEIMEGLLEDLKSDNGWVDELVDGVDTVAFDLNLQLVDKHSWVRG